MSSPVFDILNWLATLLVEHADDINEVVGGVWYAIAAVPHVLLYLFQKCVLLLAESMLDIAKAQTGTLHEVVRWVLWSLLPVMFILLLVFLRKKERDTEGKRRLAFKVATFVIFYGTYTSLVLAHVPLPTVVETLKERLVGKDAPVGYQVPDESPELLARNYLMRARDHALEKSYDRSLPSIDSLFTLLHSGNAHDLRVQELSEAHTLRAMGRFRLNRPLNSVHEELESAVRLGRTLVPLWQDRLANLRQLAGLGVKPAGMDDFDYYSSKGLALLSLARFPAEYDEVQHLFDQALSSEYTKDEYDSLIAACMMLNLPHQAQIVIVWLLTQRHP